VGSTYRIASIPGDGIGPEVVDVSRTVLDAVAKQEGFTLDWEEHPWGSDFYRKHGVMMPESGLAELSTTDAIFFGAVGDPELSDALTLWGLLIPIRREFDQYINLRPVRFVPGLRTPLQQAEGIDMLIVRENSEGEYSEIGGRFGRSTDREFATQEAIFSRAGVTRVAEYAANLAATRRKRVTSATKSNGIIHTMTFWDEIVDEVAAKHTDLEWRSVLIDALSAELVLRPQQHDVIVCSNLFGDILSDLASATIGSLGIAASGNINPEHTAPSMFESVHGSAPDIAGQGIANPFAQLGSGVMMLDHLGETKAAGRIQAAMDALVGRGETTRDIGGNLGTAEVQDALLRELGA
jgi:tartrate dehydrogenase/decarboxylase/D-malate dehydrogenase